MYGQHIVPCRLRRLGSVACAAAVRGRVLGFDAHLTLSLALSQTPAFDTIVSTAITLVGQPTVHTPLGEVADVAALHWEAVDAGNAVLVVNRSVGSWRVVGIVQAVGAVEVAQALHQRGKSWQCLVQSSGVDDFDPAKCTLSSRLGRSSFRALHVILLPALAALGPCTPVTCMPATQP